MTNPTGPNDEPVLARVKPVPGGLFADRLYDAALSDIAATIAGISAVLPLAAAPQAEELRRLQRELVKRQRDLMPDDDDAIAAVRRRCAEVRSDLGIDE